jgi:predicted DNA-binding transcriptional regulator YafY
VSKIERLLNVTAALLETRRPLTADEIRRRIPGYPERDDAFRRAFERDKDDLREMGIPLEVVIVEGSDPPTSGYVIPPDRYYLADPGLDPDELAALQMAAVMIRLGDADGEADLQALRKLGGREPADSGPAHAEVASLPRPEHLSTLFEAVTARRPAEFRYGGVDRLVEPYRLDFHKGRWYLTAHDSGRDAERRFRLDRFETPVVLGDPGAFERPAHVAGVTLDAWQLGEGEPIAAHLLIDADQLAPARAQLPPDTTWEPRPDGSAVATIAVINVDAFRSFVLAFLDHAEVLAPPELRASMIDWLETVAAS